MCGGGTVLRRPWTARGAGAPRPRVAGVELREVSFTTDKPNSKSEMAGKTLKTGRGINLKCEPCQKKPHTMLLRFRRTLARTEDQSVYRGTTCAPLVGVW